MKYSAGNGINVKNIDKIRLIQNTSLHKIKITPSVEIIF